MRGAAGSSLRYRPYESIGPARARQSSIRTGGEVGLLISGTGTSHREWIAPARRGTLAAGGRHLVVPDDPWARPDPPGPASMEHRLADRGRRRRHRAGGPED